LTKTAFIIGIAGQDAAFASEVRRDNSVALPPQHRLFPVTGSGDL
jgi:hypothetical protein